MRRDDLVKLTQSLARRPVEIEGLGTVYVRELTLGEADRFAVEIEKDGMTPDLRVKLLRFALCDEEGKPLFKEGEEDLIAGLPARVASRLVEEALKVSGILMDEVDDAKKGL